MTGAREHAVENVSSFMDALRSALGKLEEREPHAFDEVFLALAAYGVSEWRLGFLDGRGQ